MAWIPQFHHVTQIHPVGGSGQADCFQASLARYLYEAGAVPSTRDPWDLINEICIVSRGVPDGPHNPDTTLSEADNTLVHYGLPDNWTASYQDALNAPWSICLVNGALLQPAQYPASWFGSANWPDHFILWLPALNGAANWFNDPLAYDNGQQDCQYDPSSVATAFGGAYLLPTTGHGETAPTTAQVLQACALKVQPSHASIAIAAIPAAGQVLDFGTRVPVGPETWARIQWGDKTGFVLANNVSATSSEG